MYATNSRQAAVKFFVTDYNARRRLCPLLSLTLCGCVRTKSGPGMPRYVRLRPQDVRDAVHFA